ncbi:MAG: response regulator transcription factor [Bacillota bacterium]|nr:response regulator transcription factor [Bacillota bacterium]
MYRVLIVEDDPVICQTTMEYLAGWGYQVRAVEDFSRVMDVFSAYDPHLVLLDLKLPIKGGFHWCREIRLKSTVPILFLTSVGDNLTAVTAMNMGADDLIAKPFDLGMLGAKIEALLRRAYGFAAASPRITHRGLVYNPASATVRFENREIELTRNENRILQTLLEKRGEVVSRDLLMTRLWESDSFVDENTLTVNVGRLRRKLEELGAEGFIQTRKGIGYELI